MKNPENLFHNIIKIQKGIQERHEIKSGEGFSQIIQLGIQYFPKGAKMFDSESNPL